MIRDPSDGSEYEVEHHPKPLETQPYASEKPLLNTGASGLQTGSQKPENLERLEKSREWLRNYRKKDLVQSTTEVAEAPIGHPRITGLNENG